MFFYKVLQATHIKCDGIFNNSFIANFVKNLSVKKVENRFIV